MKNSVFLFTYLTYSSSTLVGFAMSYLFSSSFSSSIPLTDSTFLYYLLDPTYPPEAFIIFSCSLAILFYSLSLSILDFLKANSEWISSRVATGPLYQGWALTSAIESLKVGSNCSIAVIKLLKSSLKNSAPFGLFLECALQKRSALFPQINL